MDKAALLKLKRADVQKLAKRAGLKANRKTADMIDELVARYHPLLVPYMDAIPPASEQEAISRKLYRRQGIQPMMAAAEPERAMRRSPRKAAETAPAGSSTGATHTRRKPRELGVLADAAKQQSKRMKKKTRRAPKARLALEGHPTTKLKTEVPRAESIHATPMSEHGDIDKEMEELEMEEVEEMTSREVFSFDLPEMSPRPNGEGRTRLGKREMSTLDSQEGLPNKRPRKAY